MFLAAVHRNPALAVTSPLSHACPRTFLQKLLGRLESSSWITGDNKGGNITSEEMLEGLFTSRHFSL